MTIQDAVIKHLESVPMGMSALVEALKGEYSESDVRETVWQLVSQGRLVMDWQAHFELVVDPVASR